MLVWCWRALRVGLGSLINRLLLPDLEAFRLLGLEILLQAISNCSHDRPNRESQREFLPQMPGASEELVGLRMDTWQGTTSNPASS